MINRLHLEEAQPPAFAIRAARESGESKDEREQESLALEFKSLLAQISGQVAAIPDQAMAVGLALAQTAMTQRVRQEESVKADQRDTGDSNKDFNEGSQDRDASSRDYWQGVDRSGQRDLDHREARTEVKVSDAGLKEGTQQVAEEVVDVGDRVVEEVDTAVVQALGDTIEVAEVAVEQEVELKGEHLKAQVEQDSVEVSNTAQKTEKLDADEGLATVNEDASSTLHVRTKKKKRDDSEEGEGLEEAIGATSQRVERDYEIPSHLKKNGQIREKTRGDAAEVPREHQPEQSRAQVDAGARRSNSNEHFDQRKQFQDASTGNQNPKSNEGNQKGFGAIKELDRALAGEFIAQQGVKPTERGSDGSLQMLMLRQAFETRGNRGDMVDVRAKNPTPSVNASGAASESKANQNEQSSRSSKGLTRPQTARMMERVEATLKEAARSRDGRTISLHLEPVNLGRVKVDVSLREGALHARIAPENQQVVLALREHAHELQSSLRKLGLDVDSVSVSVTSDEFGQEMTSGDQTMDGRSFQDERNNLPDEEAQLFEKTVGNELAERSTAGAKTQDSAAGQVLDHWVA
jgi:flagellar hook-length control protein FliK